MLSRAALRRVCYSGWDDKADIFVTGPDRLFPCRSEGKRVDMGTGINVPLADGRPGLVLQMLVSA